MPIFYRFDSENDVVSNFKTTVSSGIFSGGVGSLTSFFTSSVQSGSTGAYYYDVYKTDPASDSEAEIQFSLAYGHKEGSGSLGTKGAVGSRASATIYRQMRNLLLAPNDDQFTMAGSFDTDDIAVISFNRARMREKVDPYLRPLYDALYELFGVNKIDKRIETGEIEIAPLAFMRGRTLKNCFAILDEAQNATETQIKMFLTRIGENSKLVVNGDPSQIDLINKSQSGLIKSKDILKDLKEIKIIEFDHTDVVRHPLVSKIIRAYQKKSTDDKD